jgi:hypothetical protein
MSGRAACDTGPCTWRPWLATPRFKSSAILRECGELPSGGWRGSFSGSDSELLEIHTVVLQDGDSSNSNTVETPGDDSLRLDQEQCRAPIVPQSRMPDPQDTVSPTETQPTPTARTLQDQKLMPECKNLCLQNSVSSETISQREEYGQHGLGRLPVATL